MGHSRAAVAVDRATACGYKGATLTSQTPSVSIMTPSSATLLRYVGRKDCGSCQMYLDIYF